MMLVHRDNRIEIENEYMALLLHKPDLFDIAQIKSDYLFNKPNKKVFDYAKECFDVNGCLNLVWIYNKHRDVDVEYFMQLYNDTFYHENNWKEQVELSEKSIVKFYKEDVIKRLNEKVEKGQIDYDKFMEQMKKLDDIVLTDMSVTLTKKEIDEGINEDKAKVNLNNFPKLNNSLKLVQGDFLIVGAKTGAGKSGFLLNLMNDLMTGFQCIYFNMEMSKSTIYKRIISIKTGIDMKYINHPASEYQKQQIEKAKIDVEKANLIIEHKASDIKEIKTTMMKVKNKDKHTVIFVDHLGLTKSDDGKNLYEQATEVAKQLRKICLDFDCTVIGASQLNRTAYGTDKPSLSMLKDSGEVENSASKVVLLYSKDEKNKSHEAPMIVEIVKNRDGQTGAIEMNYNKAKQVFKEV